MNNFKPTKAETVIWHIFLVAVGAALTGGAPAILEYLAGTNVDVAFNLKLAVAGALGAFVASIATSFKKDGSATQNLLQAALDLLGQVHEAVTVQTVVTPPTPLARAVEPQPIVLPRPPINMSAHPTWQQPPIQILSQPVQMPAQPLQGTYVQPNVFPQSGQAVDNTTTFVQPTPPAWSTDLHFGDSMPNLPAIPKQ